MGHYAEVQLYVRCSPNEWQHGRMVQNNSRSKERKSAVTRSLQHFLERIMSDALDEHDGKASTGGRNLRFTDDIDALAKEEQNRKFRQDMHKV